jgi:glycosyltransferase involved in cell wall biosynthesis
MPKISIIVPLLNKGPYLERSLNSVFKQTIIDFEIIIVDGGSTDSGIGIVKKYQEPRIIFLPQKGNGIADARNEGIQISKSEYIAFLDADDEWMPDFLETIFKLIDKYPDAGAFATAYVRHEISGKWSHPKYYGIPSPPWDGIIPNYFQMLLDFPPVWTSAVVVPKMVIQDIGEFKCGESSGEDLDLWFRIALKYKIAFTTKTGAIYYKNIPSSATKRNRDSNKIEAVYHTAMIALNDKHTPVFFLPAIREYVAQLQLGIASRFILNGNIIEARKIIKECKTKKFSLEKKLLFLLSFMPPMFMKIIWKFRLRE